MTNNSTSVSQPTTQSSSEDALSQVLNAMRISGSLLLDEKYKMPWAVSVPSSDSLNALLKLDGNTRIAAFHLVKHGHINIKFDSGEEQRVNAGEMVVCFSGLEHTLYEGNEQRIVPFQELMGGDNTVFEPDEVDDASCTSLVCGVFLLHDTLLNPLLAALPSILKFNIDSPAKSPRVYGVVNLLIQEFETVSSGNSYVIQRYLEILCAEVIRLHVSRIPQKSMGWLAALKDPIVGRAIEVIHAQPGNNWSVKSLADEVTISPSRFAARFSATLGESPMIYVTKWRMVIASQMLERNQRSIDQIANEVGYESMAAFSRAFKRHVGCPPAIWRARVSS